jgi:hypothetical protein
MNIPETYDYLMRARRALWTTLEVVPDEITYLLLDQITLLQRDARTSFTYGFRSKEKTLSADI